MGQPTPIRSFPVYKRSSNGLLMSRYPYGEAPLAVGVSARQAQQGNFSVGVAPAGLVAPDVGWATIDETTIRFLFTGGAGATSWVGYYRTTVGSGPFTTVILSVGQSYYDVTVAPGGSAQMFVEVSNGVATVDSNLATGSAAAVVLDAIWQYPQGTYEPRRMDMTIVHPRPDAETLSTERHRNAYPGLVYEVPVAVQGGAFPHRLELVGTEGVDYPTGMTIGQFFGTSSAQNIDYGTVRWQVPSNAAGQTWTITVRVYDQDYGRASNPSVLAQVVWTINVNAANFIFVSPTGSGSQNGTLGNEIAGIGAWYTGYQVNSPYKNKIMVYRAGTYSFPGNFNTIWGQYQPVVHVAYPGETVVLNQNNLADNEFAFAGTSPGIFIDSLKFINGYGNSASLGSNSSRCTLWRVKWQTVRSAGLSNESCFHTSAAANPRYYIALIGCDAMDLGSEIYLTDMYHNNYTIIENNTVHDTNNSGGTNSIIYPKGRMRYTTVRNNRAITNVTQNGASGFIGIPGGLDGVGSQAYEYIEVCYNSIRLLAGRAFEYGRAASGTQLPNQAWSYRNTFVGSIKIFADAAKQIAVNRDVWLGTIANDDPDSVVTNTIQAASASGIVDANNNLVSSYRNDFLGRRGFELPRVGKLPSSFVAPTRVPLAIVNPQPTASLGAKSRYLWAHSTFDYEVPISVIGGRPPFTFELTAAPAGMSIERRAPSFNAGMYSWGVIRWPAANVAASTGAQTVTVLVTDQDENQTSVTWTVTRDNTKFIFVDATNGNDANNGRLVSDGGTGPYRTLAGWYKGDDDNSSHQNQIVVYRAGTYNVNVALDPTNGFRFKSNLKPTGHIVYPGESAVWSFAGASEITTFGLNTDWFFDGIKFSSGGAHFHSGAGDERLVAWRTENINLAAPSGQPDNEGCWSFVASGLNHKKLSFVDIKISYVTNDAGPNNAVGIETYNTEDIAIDGLFATNYNGSELVYIKNSTARCTVTSVYCYEPGVSEPGRAVVQLQVGGDPAEYPASAQLTQARYCAGYRSSDTSQFLSLGDSNQYYGSVWVDRCTMVGKTAGYSQPDSFSRIESSIIVNDQSPIIAPEIQQGTGGAANITSTRAASPLNSQGLITNSNRGLKGFELYIAA